jgi:hypothetical protein
MEGNFTGHKSDLDRTDKLPTLTQDNLVQLDMARAANGADAADELHASIAELREAINEETQRSRTLESRIETQDKALAELRAEFDRETRQQSEVRNSAEAAEQQTQMTRELIGKVQAALRALHQRVVSLETYIAGRPDGWREMEQALHEKSVRIAKAEASLAEKISLLAQDLDWDESDSEAASEPATGPEPVPEAAAGPETEPAPEAGSEAAGTGAESATEPGKARPARSRTPALVGLSANAPIACAIDKELITIGRDPDCDITIPADSVSRRHAVVFREGNQTIIEDRSSTNGIFVNTVRVKRKALTDGDEVAVGDSRFRFVGGQPRD